jgi:hypothetical protein
LPPRLLRKVFPSFRPDNYNAFLKNDLRAKSTGNFRLGPDIHGRLMRLKCQNLLLQDELIARAGADVKNIRREMAIVSMPLFRIMYPNINMEALSTQYKDREEELRNIFIRGVLDKIKVNHGERGEFVEAVKASADEIKSFLAKEKMIEIPQDNLIIEPMLDGMKGLTWVRFLSPAPYETAGTYSCQINSIPDNWTNEQSLSFLEEYNNSFMYFWTIEKVYPGVFFPTFFTSKNPSIVRKLYPNQPLIKAWPLMTEDMFIYAGFRDYDLKLRLNQLKLQLKIVINYQIELNVHQGGITKERAIDYMKIQGFQTQAEAERRWNSIVLNPCEAAYPYVGYQEILDMEKEYKRLKGDAFTDKEFLQKLLSYGALPIRHLKTLITQ